MDEELTTKRRRSSARGKRATDLVLDPTLQEAFDEIERKYLMEWKSSKPDDLATRERAYVATQMIEDIKTQLQIYIDQGRLADKQLHKERLL